MNSSTFIKNSDRTENNGSKQGNRVLTPSTPFNEAKNNTS